MSAQETTAPQALARSARRSLMALKAVGRSVTLGGAIFSLSVPPVLSRSTEPSQPCTKQSWKWMRRSAAARPTSLRMASLRKLKTMDSACGQVAL